jgi:hypothetical protein
MSKGWNGRRKGGGGGEGRRYKNILFPPEFKLVFPLAGYVHKNENNISSYTVKQSQREVYCIPRTYEEVELCVHVPVRLTRGLYCYGAFPTAELTKWQLRPGVPNKKRQPPDGDVRCLRIPSRLGARGNFTLQTYNTKTWSIACVNQLINPATHAGVGSAGTQIAL